MPPTEPDDAGFQVIFNDEATIVGADDSDVDVTALVAVDPSSRVSPASSVRPPRAGPPPTTASSYADRTGLADNTAPVVKAPADKTVPVRTPFALTGVSGNGRRR